MIRSCIYLSLILFLGSCSFQRARLYKLNGNPPIDPPADHLNIRDALDLRSHDLNSKTGAYLLENGGESFIARLWYFDHAQKTIDIQYYSFAKDVTGLIACASLLRAADRGVKIRILIDDAATLMNTSEVKLLDSHDNIEIKIYNAGLRLGRFDKRLHYLSRNYKRVLKRMHNKTLTVDGIVTIIGGRNIADRYFDYSQKYNFRDRDIVLIGKAVKEVTASYNEFWDHELSVLYSELSKIMNKKKYKDPERFKDIHEFAAKTKKFPESIRKRVDDYDKEFKQLSVVGKVVWTEHATFISDKPGKTVDDKIENKRICSDTIAALIKNAKINVNINSPYVIHTNKTKALLGETVIDLFRETVKRGIEIRLLTNSLGSTDNYAAFSAYQKDRKELLRTGIRLYEFKPDAKVRYEIMIPEIQSRKDYKAVYGFHPKSLTIDKHISVVGSYNLDPRSAELNTECIVIIRSPDLCRILSDNMNKEILPENSWEITEQCDPDHKASFKKRIKMWTMRIIPKKLL
jgi:cardiolipin synthase C